MAEFSTFPGQPSDRMLAGELLAGAGLGGVESLRPVSQRSITNVILEVATDRGQRYVYKRFAWPYDVPDELNRRVKEQYLHGILRQRGVPVARIVASENLHGYDVHLMEYVPGEVLGELARDPSVRPALRGAWHEAGAAMARIHGIEIGNRAGMISGERVQPFPEGSWGAWFGWDLRKHTMEVAGQLPAETVRQLLELAERAPAAVAIARPVLLHNDPHAWNILVVKTDLGYRLAAWLDWEFAWAGDRWWDLARMAIFRFADIGSIPREFEAGYGARCSGRLRFDLYSACVALWMFGQYL